MGQVGLPAGLGIILEMWDQLLCWNRERLKGLRSWLSLAAISPVFGSAFLGDFRWGALGMGESRIDIVGKFQSRW